MQVGSGDSGNQNEEDVQRALTTGFSAECKQNLETVALRMKRTSTELLTTCHRTVMQAQRDSSDTQDVVRTLSAGFWTVMQAQRVTLRMKMW
jgi:hypothetical protein